MEVSLLTGGDDKPYVFGLATVLIRDGISFDIIGGDGLESPEWHATPGTRFLNLRGSQKADDSFTTRLYRILMSYARLIRYSWGARPKIFHIIWNNKFEYFDRTLLMLYYKALRKRVILTAHNINKAKRDGTDTALNCLTLKIQYRLCDHIFVHTVQMKSELIRVFGVSSSAITVIPFGINNAVPNSELTSVEAGQRLGISKEERTILFFGRIVPYKGLEYLVAAFQDYLPPSGCYRLIIAGRPEKDCKQYFDAIREKAKRGNNGEKIILKIEYVPDDETEMYFKAANVLVLPYRDIYQSGVLFLGYSFGLPVIASDVGGLRDEIIEGKTGFLCRPEDPADLARVIEKYFSSDLYLSLNSRRQELQEYARQRYSWDVVSQMTVDVYAKLMRGQLIEEKSQMATR